MFASFPIRTAPLCAITILGCFSFARADVTLPALISDNMVLLANGPARVWGSAGPAERVSVKFGAEPARETVADENGKWSVTLDDLPSGATDDLVIQGKNTITVKNVAVGEVWLCGGQSNMEMPVQAAADAQAEIARANHPDIRMFTVQRAATAAPQADCTGKWQVCTPATVGSFSAVGYYFGKYLEENIKAPVGLIHASWGGTGIQLWTPTDLLASDPAFANLFTKWEAAKAAYPTAKANYDTAYAQWKEAAAKAESEGKQKPQQPWAPIGGDDFGSPGCLFNGMISPLLKYSLRGVAWYQGEQNGGEPRLYEQLFPLLIESWRSRFGSDDLPFLYVQLPNWQPRKETPGESGWASIRDTQRRALELSHTGMAVTIDIGEADNVHPKNKQEVGRRLGLVAQACVYYQDADYSGPVIGGSQTEENRIRLTFRFADGLGTTDGGPVKGFAVAGEDRKFVWANAEIQGDHVLISSPDVPKPVAVRYGWADNPDCNLTNSSKLPSSPFRTDNW